jgi:hypothetical protein
VFDEDRQYRAFGIPVHEDWVEIVRQAYGDIRLAIKHGSKDLTTEWNARNEVVLIVADKLREQGVPEPIRTAWELVGYPTEQFHDKLRPGQPLGDLSGDAVLKAFKPLILNRLKEHGVSDNKDAEQAAVVGLLNARADYDPGIDGSVGWYARHTTSLMMRSKPPSVKPKIKTTPSTTKENRLRSDTKITVTTAMRNRTSVQRASVGRYSLTIWCIRLNGRVTI